jgi:hypothetical protein
MTDYLSIKLVSGEELIGELESKEDYINLLNPVQILQDYTSDGYSIVKFIPYMTWVENELFTFNHKYVIVACNPNEKLIKYYKQYMDSLKESETDNDFNYYGQSNTCH